MSKTCNQKSPHATDPLYICNPATGRWVLRSGKIGQTIIQTSQTEILTAEKQIKKQTSQLIEKPQPRTIEKIKIGRKTRSEIVPQLISKPKTPPKSLSPSKEKIKIGTKPQQKQISQSIEESPKINDKLIYYLGKMIDISIAEGEKFKAKAYSQAVQAIKKYPHQIKSGKEAQQIKGVGKSIAEKIDIIIKTGSLPQVEQQSTKSKAISELANVWGIGPIKAKQLYESGIHSIEDLKKQQHLLNNQQQIGLKYHEELQLKIPRKMIEKLDHLIHEILPQEIKVIIAGSYRRGAANSGDVDILISPMDTNITLKDIVDILKIAGIITDILSQGPSKALTIAHLPPDSHHFRMDLEFVPYDEWGASLLYFTGSKEFNIKMREKAHTLEYTLNQHGLVDNKTKTILKFDNEKAIFDELGMDYLEPQNRY